MNDLISVSVLLEEIEKRKGLHESDYDNLTDDVEIRVAIGTRLDELDQVKEIVNNLPKREFGRDSSGRCKLRGCNLCDSRKKQLRKRWIPCAERLPEENEKVVACFVHGEVTELQYLGDGLFEGIYVYDTRTVIAWMPKPEPYKNK